jgi:ATPase subunit of ABC transporter with duplicated ATPase domains
VLDEPTNHLDVESIGALEDAIERYDGTVVLVSHDRELLRALTTKLWILHERHVTEFPGGFSEWEEVSAEREHSASVRAAEEASLRKVHERKKVAARQQEETGSSKDQRRKQRNAQRELEEQEAQIESLEARIVELSGALEDPEMYTRPDGIEQARKLGLELERVRRELDQALARWTAASEAIEAHH